MIDWQDYKYSMAVIYHDGSQHEHHSDNILFLIHLGESGLESGRYTSATIFSNKGHSYAS